MYDRTKYVLLKTVQPDGNEMGSYICGIGCLSGMVTQLTALWSPHGPQ